MTPPRPLTLPDGSPAIDAWTLSPTALHVNHGSFGAVPRRTQDYQHQLRTAMEADPVAWFGALPERVGRAREQVAAFLGAPPEHTVLVPNASAAATVVYNFLPHHPGGEIVVTDHGYGAVTMGAERLARRWGGSVRTAHVPLDADADTAREAVVAEFGPNTRLVVLDQITSATARQFPIAAICAQARERGIVSLVDGAHAPGMYADPTAGLGCDFWFGNLHKFACAPRGTAALVATNPADHAHLFPLIDSWGSLENFPRRFDTQGTIDVTGYLAAASAFDELERLWGWDTVRTYMGEVADYAEGVLATALGERTGLDHRVNVGMPVTALRLVRLPEGLGRTRLEADAMRDRAVDELRIETAFTSFGGRGYFRLSTHAYTTAADFDDAAARLVPALVAWADEATP